MRAEPPTTVMAPTMAPVVSSVRELADTITLAIDLPLGLAMPTPGQFAMLWAPGIGEIPISYSGIGPDRRVEHTIRIVGATSAALAGLGPGDRLGVRGPFGRGWRLGDLLDHDVLILAGGLGVAPLRPVVESAGDLGARSVRVCLGARSPEVVLYAEQIVDRWDHLVPVVTVDHATADWDWPIGPLRFDLAGPIVDPRAISALVCGPEIMMRMVSRELAQVGVPPNRIQLSLERNMQCGVGQCGHCQLGSLFTCVDGPVVDWATAEPLLAVRER